MVRDRRRREEPGPDGYTEGWMRDAPAALQSVCPSVSLNRGEMAELLMLGGGDDISIISHEAEAEAQHGP